MTSAGEPRTNEVERNEELRRRMYPEELARLRCRRLLEEAEEARLARRLKAVRFWRGVAAFAAARVERRLPRN